MQASICNRDRNRRGLRGDLTRKLAQNTAKIVTRASFGGTDPRFNAHALPADQDAVIESRKMVPACPDQRTFRPQAGFDHLQLSPSVVNDRS